MKTNDNDPIARFHPTGRKATQPPHSEYPDGLVLDTTGGTGIGCAVDLVYPAECIGLWELRCNMCGVSLSLTAAGRLDDPRRVIIGCGMPPNPETVIRRPWNATDDATTDTRSQRN